MPLGDTEVFKGKKGPAYLILWTRPGSQSRRATQQLYTMASLLGRWGSWALSCGETNQSLTQTSIVKKEQEDQSDSQPRLPEEALAQRSPQMSKSTWPRCSHLPLSAQHRTASSVSGSLRASVDRMETPRTTQHSLGFCCSGFSLDPITSKLKPLRSFFAPLTLQTLQVQGIQKHWAGFYQPHSSLCHLECNSSVPATALEIKSKPSAKSHSFAHLTPVCPFSSSKTGL